MSLKAPSEYLGAERTCRRASVETLDALVSLLAGQGIRIRLEGTGHHANLSARGPMAIAGMVSQVAEMRGAQDYIGNPSQTASTVFSRQCVVSEFIEPCHLPRR